MIKHAFNVALKEWEWTRENPVLKVAMEKEPPSRDRWLRYGEEVKLLAGSPLWLQEVVTFATETGCRRGEMLSLGWESVDFQKRVAVIFGKKTGDKNAIKISS